MLNNDFVKKALSIHKKAVDNYNGIVQEVQVASEWLYNLRVKSIIIEPHLKPVRKIKR